ncbi:MAG: hypothetical protein NTZ04_02175 [Chloroflexi bacterium]|nr:hypothetical protein [Chloroflexota bacterium]
MEQRTPDDIDKNNNGNTGTEKSPLTVSDWVTFLSNEKQGNISNFMGFMAVVLALIGMTLVIQTTRWEKISGFVAIVILVCVSFKVGMPLHTKSTRAEKILDDIMSGNLTEPEKIQKRWKRSSCGELTKEHEGKYWQRGAFLAGAFWFAGWLFTIAFANLVWSKIILGLVVWPYYLGKAVG